MTPVTQNKKIKVADPAPRNDLVIQCRLSFQPLFDAWKMKIEEDEDGAGLLYKELLQKVSKHAELLEPISDISILKKHRALLSVIMSTVFPVTLSQKEDLFAVSVPFTYKVIYSSELFGNLFLRRSDGEINIQNETSKNIIKEKLNWAYQLVLNKFYGGKFPFVSKSVHPYKHPLSGLEKFMELELDARFVEVKAKKALPELPPSLSVNNLADILKSDELERWLPLDMFEFEGMMLVRIRDETEQQIINEIKNNLLTVNAFTEAESFENLQGQIQSLIGKFGLRIGITPFFKINGQFVLSSLYENISLLFGHDANSVERKNYARRLEDYFSSGNNLLLVSKLTAAAVSEYPFLKHIHASGGKSVMICPLMNDKELLGALEVVSDEPGQLHHHLFGKISPAIPLFTLSLEKSAKDLEAKVDSIIKEKFTAVQSAVEWRFTEAALNYIASEHKDEDAKIENIVFEDVYPFYGAIDIRNSSGERSQAIQQDLIEQLQAIGGIIEKASREINSPLLNNIRKRTEEYLSTISTSIHSDDEFEIHSFLKKDVKELFKNLKYRIPAIQPDIDSYFSIIDSDTKTWNLHRKEFEDSITYINDMLARFVDREDTKAQQLFPHYFERFVTDGIDFNIYIGQSISPEKNLTPAHLKELKIWQLQTLVRAAIFGKRLERKAPVALQTTQLVLAHNLPISISFRPAERKFDVDGAYNIRYEIIKKRIDKVHIRDTGERLTQPGTIAIVYSQPDEATEYKKYLEQLVQEELLIPGISEFELEELQGVGGLKALRVGINLDKEETKPAQTKLAAH